MMNFVFASEAMSKSKAFFSKEERFCEACPYPDKQKPKFR